MQITRPEELIGKEVYDDQGSALGILDKYWKSWDRQQIEWFFGIRPYDNVRDAWFRGTTKLFPIHSSYIKDIGEVVTLKKGMDDLSHEWKKVVSFEHTSWPTDDLMERGIYDRCGSRVGVFFAWTEHNNNHSYGCFIDPYLSEKWHYALNVILPIKTEYFYDVTDSITLNTTIDELKKFWDGYISDTITLNVVKSAKKATPRVKKKTKHAKTVNSKTKKKT